MDHFRKFELDSEDFKAFVDKIRILAKNGNLKAQNPHKTLNDIKAGTVLEARSYTKTKTSIGSAILLDVIETIKKPKGQPLRLKYSLMVAARVEEEAIRHIPCTLYYAGMASMSSGQMYHDLRFYSPADTEVLYTHPSSSSSIELLPPLSDFQD